MFPAAHSLWTPKLGSSSSILLFRIEVEASIQEQLFDPSSGQLSSTCCGLFVYPLLGSSPTVWKPATWRPGCFPSPGGSKSFSELRFWFLAWIFYTQLLAIRKSLYDANFCSYVWDFWSSEWSMPWLRGMDFLMNLLYLVFYYIDLLYPSELFIFSLNLLSFSLKVLKCPLQYMLLCRGWRKHKFVPHLTR